MGLRQLLSFIKSTPSHNVRLNSPSSSPLFALRNLFIPSALIGLNCHLICTATMKNVTMAKKIKMLWKRVCRAHYLRSVYIHEVMEVHQDVFEWKITLSLLAMTGQIITNIQWLFSSCFKIYRKIIHFATTEIVSSRRITKNAVF